MKKAILTAAAALALGLAATVPAALAADPEEVAKLEREAQQIMKSVEAIRGLKFSGPVKKGIQSKEELRAFVMTELAKELPDAKIDALRKAYVKLGFMKPEVDLKKVLVDLYSEQIAGFYNPERKELFLIEHGGPEQPMLMAHELTHALQDQNFELLGLQKGIVDNDDRSLALTSMIEGDATVVMVVYMLQQQGLPLDVQMLPDIGTLLRGMAKMGEVVGAGGGEVMKSAPKVLTESLMFGYVEGASFCQRMIKKHGGKYSAVTDAFRDLPQSSEQILHPDKYLGKERDEPVEVVLPDVAKELGAGWKLLTKNVMGEFQTALLFKELLPSDDAERAAAGWDGDAWQVLEGPDGEVVLAWVSEWDTERDAQDFAETWVAFATKRGGGHDNVLVQSEKRVTLVDGLPADRAEQLAGRLERALETRPYAPIAVAANPFTSVPLPEGFTDAKADDKAILRKAAGPDGAELLVLESAAAHEDGLAAARADYDERAKQTRGSAYAKVGDRDGRSSADGEGKREVRWFAVRGDKTYILVLRGPSPAVGDAIAALERSRPDLAPPAKPADRKKEPTLF